MRNKTEANIIKTVSLVTGVPYEQILNGGRERPIADARRLSMFFIKREFKRLSLKEIGLIFKKDHSTVLYSCKVTEQLHETDNDFRRLFKEINERLGEVIPIDFRISYMAIPGLK